MLNDTPRSFSLLLVMLDAFYLSHEWAEMRNADEKFSECEVEGLLDEKAAL
jgi:hypothetical protein